PGRLHQDGFIKRFQSTDPRNSNPSTINILGTAQHAAGPPAEEPPNTLKKHFDHKACQSCYRRTYLEFNSYW
ncbi:Leucine-Rich Repeat And Fibronectin Type Iii Domain-Containing Protein 1, partial [Manis pentadactyla]